MTAVTLMERLATGGVALVLCADMVMVPVFQGILKRDVIWLGYAVAVFVMIGYLGGVVTLVLELNGKKAGGLAWAGAGLLIFGLFGLFLWYFLIICGVGLPLEVPLAITSLGAFPLLAATYFFGALWFPKATVGMSVGFGLGQLLWAIGFIVRFTTNDTAGTVMLILGTVTMVPLFTIGQVHRAKAAKAVTAAEGLLVPSGVTYGTV